MIDINKMMLIDEHGRRITDEHGGEASNRIKHISLTYSVTPSDKKPWPYEIALHAELEVEHPDSEEENELPAFIVDLRYAAKFNQDDISDEQTFEVFSSAWPFIRAELVGCFRRFDIPTALIPLHIRSVNE